jgi:Phosphopantetheine attachment site.
MEQLINQIKEQLIEVLNLEDLKPTDIETDAPLFGEGLGLDSIDALEIILLMEKNYGIKLEKPAEARPYFYSVKTLAEFIAANRAK